MTEKLITEVNKPRLNSNGKIYLDVPRKGITMPQWIEGIARGTMIPLSGGFVRRQVYLRAGTNPSQWFFADDTTKTTIV